MTSQHWLAFRHLKPISFKPGTVIDITKLYSLIPVLLSLTFSQDQRVTRNLELVQSLLLSCMKKPQL